MKADKIRKLLRLADNNPNENEATSALEKAKEGIAQMRAEIRAREPKPKPKRQTVARRGSGSIYQQPGSSKYYVQYFVNGRRKREATGTDDYKAAQQFLTQRLGQVNKGEPIVTKRQQMLVSELFAGLLADYRENGRKSTADVERRIKLHLQPYFGDMLTASVNKDVIKAYRSNRLAQGSANANVNREVAALKTAFYLAEEKLPKLPVFPKILEEPKPRRDFLTEEQYARLTAHIAVNELWLRCYAEIALTYGWRLRNVERLKVRQIDFKGRTVCLEAGTTKNGDAIENPITPRLYALLKECCAGKGPDDQVLTRRTSKGHKPVKDFRKRWNALRKAAGVPHITRHGLRRSMARILTDAGVAESTVMEIGGWKTNSVFKRYLIKNNRDKIAALDRAEQQRAMAEAERTAIVSAITDQTDTAESSNSQVPAVSQVLQ